MDKRDKKKTIIHHVDDKVTRSVERFTTSTSFFGRLLDKIDHIFFGDSIPKQPSQSEDTIETETDLDEAAQTADTQRSDIDLEETSQTRMTQTSKTTTKQANHTVDTPTSETTAKQANHTVDTPTSEKAPNQTSKVIPAVTIEEYKSIIEREGVLMSIDDKHELFELLSPEDKLTATQWLEEEGYLD